MASLGYDEDGVEDYLQRGLLLRITRDTFRFYQELINAAREAHLDPIAGEDTNWEGGRGEALIDHHSQKLLDIRTFSPDRRALILQTYTYLRDAAQNNFSTPAMSELLWAQISQLRAEMRNTTAKKGGGNPPADGSTEPTYKCSHCRCAALHRAFKKGPGKRNCPFLSKGYHVAQALGKAASAKLKEDPKLKPTVVVEQVLQEYSP